jgi:hypothetical protein
MYTLFLSIPATYCPEVEQAMEIQSAYSAGRRKEKKK